MIVGRALAERLMSLGFNSFDHTWAEAQAVAAATHSPPDLVVVGASIVCGSPVTTARQIAKRFDAPMLLVGTGECDV